MKKIPIWKNVILILSVLVVIIIATFAWFYSGTTAKGEDYTVKVGKAFYVQISDGAGNNWSDDLDVTIGINKDFKEISGDGSNFFTPVYDVAGSDADEEGSEGFYTKLVSFEKLTDEEKSDYYYEEVLEFRSDMQQDIYLDPESYVIAADPEIESYIHGAIRIAFFEIGEDGKETLKCIWAPNSEIEYSAEENTFRDNGTTEAYYCYQVGSSTSATSAEIFTNGESSGYNDMYKFMWSNTRPSSEEGESKDGQNLPSNAPALLTLDIPGGENDKNHFYKTMKVKVWLEGYDRECVSQLNGQRFTMKLQFEAEEENNDE